MVVREKHFSVKSVLSLVSYIMNLGTAYRVLGEAGFCVPGRINPGPDLRIPKAESARRMFFLPL